ncbi:nucleic acid-binding protein [Halobacteriales archaeon QS_1_68_17]|nr:MAG: nucleic acid-binding protein [Halobacteriales archaeon QS_1_68_17]
MTREFRDTGYDDFLEALEAGEGYYLAGSDGDGFLPPRNVHPRTGEPLEEEPMPEAGEIVSLTRTQVAAPQLADDAPYTVAIAEFGPVRLTGQVRAEDPKSIEIGTTVEADVGETETTGDRIVVFRPR